MSGPAYSAWIAEWAKAHDVRCACERATLDMVERFPELRRVPGHVRFVVGGGAAHWWCVTADGTVVDPTANQFLEFHGGIARYEEWVGPLPSGKCPNCGEYVYPPITHGNPHEECYEEYRAYVMREIE